MGFEQTLNRVDRARNVQIKSLILLKAFVDWIFGGSKLVVNGGVILSSQKINQKAVPAVEKVGEANLPTEFGEFRIAGFKSAIDDEVFVVLIKGQLKPDRASLVRIHSQCLTGDVFHSIKCDCHFQLHRAIEMIQDEGHGVIVYQNQEGRGIGILNKIRAYQLQDAGADTVEANLKLGLEADARDYKQCAEILKQLGLTKIRLLSNNPDKLAALQEAGIEVVERVALEVEPGETALNYLKTKKEKMGHLLEQV